MKPDALSEGQYEMQRRQAERVRELLEEANDLKTRALAAEAQSRAIAKSWQLDLDSLKPSS